MPPSRCTKDENLSIYHLILPLPWSMQLGLYCLKGKAPRSSLHHGTDKQHSQSHSNFSSVQPTALSERYRICFQFALPWSHTDSSAHSSLLEYLPAYLALFELTTWKYQPYRWLNSKFLVLAYSSFSKRSWMFCDLVGKAEISSLHAHLLFLECYKASKAIQKFIPTLYPSWWLFHLHYRSHF